MGGKGCVVGGDREPTILARLPRKLTTGEYVGSINDFQSVPATGYNLRIHHLPLSNLPSLPLMLGWLFPPKCPCSLPAKQWLEERLQWLSEQFDDHVFNGKPLVLPTEKYFPDPYDGSQVAVRRLVTRACGYMDVDPEMVELKFVAQAGKLQFVNDAGQAIGQAAGTFKLRSDGTYRITIDEQGLHDPMELVGTIAHELAHARLLGEYRLQGDEFDHEITTDLTVVFLGMGIFLANVPRNWDSDRKKWPGTKLIRHEYMTRPMFSYALAHLAWFRGEKSPPWSEHLHFNAHPDFRQAVRYLFETEDSTFQPVKVRQKRQLRRE